MPTISINSARRNSASNAIMKWPIAMNTPPSARPARSCGAPRQACVDVAGIGALRQAAKPARDLLSAHPVTMDEDMALTERRVVTRIAELSATLDASLRHAALDGGEFER